MTTLQVVTWNVGGGSGSGGKVHDSLTALVHEHGMDLGLFTEVADREPVLDDLFGGPHWGLYQPHGDAKEHCAIVWRKSLLTKTGDPKTVKLSDADPSIDTGAGGVQNKWVHEVPLKVDGVDRTALAMVVHMIASVRGDAATPEDKEARQDLYKQGVQVLKGRVEKRRKDGFILLGGDWNVEPDDAFLDPLHNHLKLGHEKKNTKGDRMIDFIFREDDDEQKGVEHVETQTLELPPSDHKALKVTYRVT